MSQNISILGIPKPVLKHVRPIAYEVALHSLSVKFVILLWINTNIRNTTKSSQVIVLEFFSYPYFFWQLELQGY